MEELTLKLKMLWLYGWGNRKEWVHDVWQRDWSASMCCSGYHCGCGGSDYASWWEYLWTEHRGRKETTDDQA